MNSFDKSKRPPGRIKFFGRLSKDLSTSELEPIECAYRFSKCGHSKELRDSGRRYFDHPKGATWIYIYEFGGRDPRVIIVTLLHDIRENTFFLSHYRISLNFGEESALDVHALTKRPEGEETLVEYIQRIIKQGPWAILAKLFDNLDNARTLDGCTKEKRERKIKEYKENHVRLLIPALRKCGEPWASYADALEKKFADAFAVYESV
jgi:(p)ppGpp synthase/HD superfamily hydrolase